MKIRQLKNNATNKKQTGLTLVELLMGVAIVGIIASVAVPSFSSMSAAQKVAGVAQKIQQDLLYARSEAVKQNTNIHLSFSTGTNWCYGFNDSGSTCNCNVSGTPTSCKISSTEKSTTADAFTNISLSTAGSLNLNGANFNPTRGSVERNNTALNDGAITVTRGSNSATIKINTLGRSSICSNSLTQFASC